MSPAMLTWSAYWTVVANALIDSGIAKRGERGGFLTDAELVELDDAITAGTTPQQFAQRIIDRAATEAHAV